MLDWSVLSKHPSNWLNWAMQGVLSAVAAILWIWFGSNIGAWIVAVVAGWVWIGSGVRLYHAAKPGTERSVQGTDLGH